MSMLVEFTAVVFLYMLAFSYIIKRAGGRELREIEKEISRLMERAKRGDQEAFSKLNRLNTKRMRIVMRIQFYLFPFIILFFLFLKRRYAQLSVTLFGHSFGWLALFLLLGIPFSTIAEKIAVKLVGYR